MNTPHIQFGALFFNQQPVKDKETDFNFTDIEKNDFLKTWGDKFNDEIDPSLFDEFIKQEETNGNS